jgi:membrane protease YdiL (CAAX protease family)
MTADEEYQHKKPEVRYGVIVFVLLAVGNLIVGGISSVVFGLHFTMLLSETLIFVIPLSFLPVVGYSLRRFLSFPGSPHPVFWLWLVLSLASLFVVVSDVSGYMHQLWPRPELWQEAILKFFVAETWPEYLFRLFAAGIMAGFCEEFAFRGFLQTIFTERLGRDWGIVLTAFLFALIHLDPWNFFSLFLLGLFLGYLVYLTGNLWIAIFIHFLFNSISFTIWFFSPDAGSDFSYTSPFYITVIFAVIFAISLHFIRRTHQKETVPSSQL